MAQSTLEIILQARDKASGSINKVSGSLRGLSGAAGQVGRGVGKVGLGLARVGAIAATTFVAGIATAAKVAGDFESQLNVINTIARENEAGLGAIGEGIRKLARETGAPLEDLTAGYYDLLSAGIKVADAQEVLNVATRFGIGALATTAESVDLLTTALNSYNLAGSEAAGVGDMFAKAVELGKVKGDEIAASLANVAPIASQFGIGLDEIAAAYGYLTSQGTPAAEVTTQMARAIIELNKPSADLLKLQKKLGKSYAKIAAEKGLQVALQELRTDAEKANVPFQELFGRIEALKFAYQTTGDKASGFVKTLNDVHDAAGTANEQFAERAKGLNYQVGRLKANLIDAAITLGEGLTPALGRLADKVTAFVEANRGNLKQLGTDVGKFIDGIDFDAVVKAGQSFVDVLKLALDVVKRIPPEILAATAGFLTLNKLSGGLIGQGLGDIVGGLGSAVTRGAAARLPGVGQLFAQPVFVTNWPPGMGLGGGAGPTGGGRGGLVGGLVKATIAGAVVAGGIQAGIDLAGLNDPRHRTSTGKVFRGTNVPSEQLANQLRVAERLQERADAGDTFAAKQLVGVKAEIARLQGATATTRAIISTHQQSIANENRNAAAYQSKLDALFLRLPPPMVTVNLNVAPAGVVNKYVVIRRYGATGGSRERL